jgi:hypothetical protein
MSVWSNFYSLILSLAGLVFTSELAEVWQQVSVDKELALTIFLLSLTSAIGNCECTVKALVWNRFAFLLTLACVCALHPSPRLHFLHDQAFRASCVFHDRHRSPVVVHHHLD